MNSKISQMLYCRQSELAAKSFAELQFNELDAVKQTFISGSNGSQPALGERPVSGNESEYSYDGFGLVTVCLWLLTLLSVVPPRAAGRILKLLIENNLLVSNLFFKQLAQRAHFLLELYQIISHPK